MTNSMGMPTNSTTPKIEVSQGPRTGLRHLADENGPWSRPETPGEERPAASSSWPRAGSSPCLSV